jgi:hypothetical protein
MEDVRLIKVLILAAAALVPWGLARCGDLDPAFAGLPLDQWLAGGEQPRMRWSVNVSHPRLSVHQRLMAEVEVRVDGAEIASRRGEGQFLVLLQLSDSQGSIYQDHLAIDLAKVKEGVAKQDVTVTFAAFVTPGQYRVAAALYDTGTREHCAKQDRLEVAPLRNDPLPDAWRSLPAVEYAPPFDPPDSWYLPSLTERLRLPLRPHSPVQIELLVNLTPSESGSSSSATQSRNLSVLIPALKVLSELDGNGARLGAELLDLARQRVAFRQEDARVLDWPALKRSLATGGAGTIDLGSLERHGQSAAFFVEEVGKVIGAPPDRPSGSGPNAQRVLIVLSSPLEFGRGVNLEPIAGFPPDCLVFYIRYHSPPPALSERPLPARGPRYGPRRGQPLERRGMDAQFDQLESTLKPLAPHLFDVETPEQFRKALATMIDEISNL